MGMVVEVSKLRITPTKQEMVRTVHGISPLHSNLNRNSRKCQELLLKNLANPSFFSFRYCYFPHVLL